MSRRQKERKKALTKTSRAGEQLDWKNIGRLVQTSGEALKFRTERTERTYRDVRHWSVSASGLLSGLF